MTSVRLFVPGQFEQGEDEELPYVVDFANWLVAPVAACVAISVNGSNLSASLLRSSGSAIGITGASITTPCVINVTSGCDYRVQVRAEQNGIAESGYFCITGAS